jgi:hypothetical protein
MSLIPLSRKRTEIRLSMWMGDAFLSVSAAIFLLFVFVKKKEDRELSALTALDLFPVIAAVVASAVGGTVAGAPPKSSVCTWHLDRQLDLPAAMMIMVIYFQRLTIHKLAPRESHSERLSATGSSHFRRFWGHATWEDRYGHLPEDSHNS